MSRNLPVTPNLEHLRKQAKHRLTEMQRDDPSLQLADAQHALAREYGFRSWPKLKAHVESLALSRIPNATSAASPFIGTWTANVAKSRRHPLNPFRGATMRFDVDGPRVTITDDVVGPDGRTEHGKHTIVVDGHERPAGSGYSLTAAWRNPHVLETIGRKDGEVIGRGRYEVTDDGTTMTISSDQQTIILDRVDSTS
jgi:hypothetical protein